MGFWNTTHAQGSEWAEDRSEITAGRLTGYVVGLDLGKSQDFTALCVAEIWACERLRWQRAKFEALAQVTRRIPTHRYRVVNVHRYPRGTPYPEIGRSVQKVIHQLPTQEDDAALFVDKTGVGAPVVDAMREAGLRLTGVSITGGSRVNRISGQDVNVPKSVLASALDIALAEDRLELTSQADASNALRAELQGFRVKKTVHGNETMEAWREGLHDDLVLATALAIWGADNRPQPARYTTAYAGFMGR
ncbi:hypothetical protein [Tanticharoenia sakaeratensis]|uniref:Terminase large subunit gp17-like C-terminal domain-containing protein n=1 Tax=Tanticharoenia sakaeratensis NBRC 103193 TaxID=1231623 RepID=A0A0D6MP58_9PROT|nr:hypothetical protein [Tanticharoenia sakaeratensis]GAN55472.1 hypothetical protein Tasa_048_097 [Tanticharoenia sakaeratensis NBRC 103193]GBQ21981.1 hypothetical protein AA103193_1914 [Tanticharoenia sakaeratensis NBRC 103193]